MRPLFLPSARQLNVLIPIGMSALGYALYMRYLVIQQTTVGLACDGGLATWLCATRRLMIGLHQHSVFGWLALGAAALNLVRPSLILFAFGMVAAALGVVLYNVGLAALAAALLILSFARPVIGTT
ncbi:MAG TPA: hypothetical protein VK281_08810 [Xanthobacteraceae bacterium]|nr:hypothetical protein [Xanthobacteraceae bacterium]